MESTIQPFLNELASDAPAPGGDRDRLPALDPGAEVKGLERLVHPFAFVRHGHHLISDMWEKSLTFIPWPWASLTNLL